MQYNLGYTYSFQDCCYSNQSATLLPMYLWLVLSTILVTRLVFIIMPLFPSWVISIWRCGSQWHWSLSWSPHLQNFLSLQATPEYWYRLGVTQQVMYSMYIVPRECGGCQCVHVHCSSQSQYDRLGLSGQVFDIIVEADTFWAAEPGGSGCGSWIKRNVRQGEVGVVWGWAQYWAQVSLVVKQKCDAKDGMTRGVGVVLGL